MTQISLIQSKVKKQALVEEGMEVKAYPLH